MARLVHLENTATRAGGYTEKKATPTEYSALGARRLLGFGVEKGDSS
jgi:hypothetical protein